MESWNLSGSHWANSDNNLLNLLGLESSFDLTASNVDPTDVRSGSVFYM